MCQLLDVNLEVIQVFPHASGLLLIGKVLLGTKLSCEGWHLLVPGFLLPGVWEGCLQTSQDDLAVAY